MQRQALPTRRVDRDPILALVIPKGDEGLPLALEVPLEVAIRSAMRKLTEAHPEVRAWGKFLASL